MPSHKPQRIAVIGTGIAGATCARALSMAGHAVHVFDKSRGPGGRLATRRIDWVDAQGQACTAQLDHGAVGITARSAAFQHFVDQALHAGHFDAVVLALPPAQVAPLLAPHHSGWARHASVAPMQPCWTLMGVADAAADAPAPAARWDLAQPLTGPLACVLRNDARPGRERVPGQVHWVAHARAGWSRRHLEQPAAWVQAEMQTALAEHCGQPVNWLHCEVHRWRYAMPRAQRVAPAEACWWDAAQGLGVCGDFLGGCGVEGAWLSAQTLAAALLQRASEVADAPAEFTVPAAARRIAA